MHDFIESLRLGDVQHFLWTGHPPIIIQLIAFNTILMVIVILRRARNTNSVRRPATAFLQWILIATNLAVLAEEQWIPYAYRSRVIFMEEVHHFTRAY